MITILPARVQIVSFPRSHLAFVTYAIVKTCLFQDMKAPDYFFSFTENTYEVSIVANQEVIDKEVLPHLSAFSDVNTSPDVFRVLQVDDPNGQDASGKRISDLSEPLALGKFSIFYMSTYQTDFVLIKERRIREAVQTLMDHGFAFDQESLHDLLATSPVLPAQQTPLSHENHKVNFESDVLTSELRCAGLNPHYQSSWAMTILKIISYPDLIEGHTTDEIRFFSYTATSDGISLLADQHILDLFDEDMLFQDPASLRVIQVNLSGADLDRCGIVRSIAHPLTAGAHINIMYQSTATSANIIVSAEDIQRAVEILKPDLEKILLNNDDTSSLP